MWQLWNSGLPQRGAAGGAGSGQTYACTLEVRPTSNGTTAATVTSVLPGNDIPLPPQFTHALAAGV
jgi:hypothetical protein